MQAPYICLRCFRQLLRSNGQVRNASFVSLGRTADRDDGSNVQIQEGMVVNGSYVDSDTKRYNWRQRKPLAQRYQEQTKPVGMDNVLETLFSSNTTKEKGSQVSRYSRTPKDQQIEYTAGGSTIDRRLHELHNQLKKGDVPLGYIWTCCQQILHEKNWRGANAPSTDIDKSNEIALSVFRDILLAICSKQRISVHDTSTVTAATVIQTYTRHGVMRYWWDRVIWSQLEQVIRLRHGASDRMPGESLKARKHALMQDILEMWSIFTWKYQTDQKNIHISDSMLGEEGIAPRQQMVKHFLLLLPKHPRGEHIHRMAAAAIMTLDILDAEKIDCTPLLGEFFRRLRKGARLNIWTAETCLTEAGSTSEIIEKALKRWMPFKEEKTNNLSRIRDRFGERRWNTPWNDLEFTQRIGDIDGALDRKDTEDLIKIWENFQEYLEADQPIGPETKDMILARFLRNFWGLSRSDQAIRIWNYMISSGQMPGQIHWNAMLSGCVRGKDITSLQEIWANMSHLKQKADINTWTTYIHGLIKLRKWQEGLAALETLGRTWKGTPAKGRPSSRDIQHPPNSVTPTIAPVHAALSALVDTHRFELTPIIIAWAESQKLHLETYTFNILLKPLVYSGTQEEIQSHLQRMAVHKCSPDVATFTIIINGLVSHKHSNFHNLPPEAQERSILSILTDMEAKGIPPNAYSYSTLIDGLLGGKRETKRNTDPNNYNISAARTVLAHMQSRNLQPSTHIYTILMTHYFSCKPPDLAAIDSLWISIEHSGQIKTLDPWFYDILIEGYAEIDEIEKALQFLRIVPDQGKSPGWRALYATLAALNRAQEWDLCRELMRDVEDTKEGLLKHGQGTFKMKPDFYALVDELRAKGVVMGGEEQIV